MSGQETYESFLKQHGITKESEEEIALLETVFGISFSPEEAPALQELHCSEPACTQDDEESTEDGEEMTDDEILQAVKTYLQEHPEYPWPRHDKSL